MRAGLEKIPIGFVLVSHVKVNYTRSRMFWLPTSRLSIPNSASRLINLDVGSQNRISNCYTSAELYQHRNCRYIAGTMRRVPISPHEHRAFVFYVSQCFMSVS